MVIEEIKLSGPTGMVGSAITVEAGGYDSSGHKSSCSHGGEVPHVVMLAYPLQGHITPLLRMATVLASSGVFVTFVTTEFNVSRLRGRMKSARTISNDATDHRVIKNVGNKDVPDASPDSPKKKSENDRIFLVGISDGLPASHNRDPMDFDFIMSIDTAVPISFDLLLATILRRPSTPPPPSIIIDPSTTDDPSNPKDGCSGFDLLSASNVDSGDNATDFPPFDYITCIISDSFLVWSHDLARKYEIPQFAFWPNSMATFACAYSYREIAAHIAPEDPFSQEVYTGPKREQIRIRECIPGIAELRGSELPFHTPDGERSAEWMRYHVSKQMDVLDETLGVVFNSFPDLESQVYKALCHDMKKPKLFPMGPLVVLPPHNTNHHTTPCPRSSTRGPSSTSLLDEDMDCIDWLSLHKPSSVLYISMGSLYEFTPREALELASALMLHPSLPFLWVLRGTPALTADESVAHLVGSHPRGKVVKWAPQVQVLSHPSVGGFLTHCGWNSTLETITSGVPIIGWPQLLDQRTNCWSLVHILETGIGPLPPSPTCAEFDDAISSLMRLPSGNTLRERASSIRAICPSSLFGLQSFLGTLSNITTCK